MNTKSLRTKQWIWWLVMAVLLTTGVAAAGYQLLGVSEVSSIGLKKGQPAPEFSSVDIYSKPVKLSALRGKPILLNFWATWCPPCRAEMPEIEAMFQKYKNQVEFIGISPSDSVQELISYTATNGFNWTFISDADSEISFSYQVAAFPTTYIIDISGKISSVIVGGPLSRERIEKELVSVGVNKRP
jgi:thiol-disulfide isomerase/thioredoxin